MTPFNTRIAPSPTGDMHIGTARTAYFNWLAARASGGKFMLRIDDTDQKRNNPEYIKVILDTMKWLGLDYDSIVYQSSRFETYRIYADDLVHRGFAKHDNGAIVLTFPLNHNGEVVYGSGRVVDFPKTWHDEIIGDVKISADDFKNMEGMVLIKSDGSPSYNFCSIVDDLTLGINYVIRGVDHITNTSKQVILHKLLEYDTTKLAADMIYGDDRDLPKFAHLGLICVGGKPMSKRDGAASMLHYMNAGYDADAMLNFLARLGWGPTVDDKTTVLLPRERMVELFLTGGKMRNQSSGYDAGKLESFDRKYKAQKGVWRTKDRLT